MNIDKAKRSLYVIGVWIVFSVMTIVMHEDAHASICTATGGSVQNRTFMSVTCSNIKNSQAADYADATLEVVTFVVFVVAFLIYSNLLVKIYGKDNIYQNIDFNKFPSEKKQKELNKKWMQEKAELIEEKRHFEEKIQRLEEDNQRIDKFIEEIKNFKGSNLQFRFFVQDKIEELEKSDVE
ncbi:MAG: hypothetical protein ACE5KE_02480 [Methanosarcinales archaeon]